MTMRYISAKIDAAHITISREIILKTGEAVIQSWTLNPQAFSIRAGEYGLDPVEDADKVWDILEHEMNMDDDIESPLLTADTLEEAREVQLARINKERDKLRSRSRSKPWTEEESNKHNEVRSKILEACPVDSQLATLFRIATKEHIKLEKRIRADQAADPRTTTQIMKSQMIDDIRRIENV